MKKSISVIVAIVLALCTVCTVSFLAFAQSDDVKTADPPTTSETRPGGDRDTTTSTKAETTTKNELSEVFSKIEDLLTTTTTLPNKPTKDTDDIVTGGTAVYDEPTKKEPTKKPAVVSSNIPNTGSSTAVPAVALLALIAGTVAVIKTKKDEE